MPRPSLTIRTIVAASLLASILMLTTPITSTTSTLASPPQSSVLSPQASAIPAPQSSSPFGVAGVMRWPDWGTFSRPADLMLQTGGGWVREDFAWGLIEPHPDQFDWTATDRIVGALAERNLSVLGIIAYSASWATATTADDSNPISVYPPNLDKYYTFVRTLVGRYKNVVHHWEVWNEPDNPLFWKPVPNPKEYAALLQTAYRAVKDADPNAKVLSAGVSGNAVPFLEDVMLAGAANSFDILAIHPYAVPLNPAQGRIESRPEVHKELDVELNKYRAFLQRHKLDRPIWVTEVGWPAQDWGLDDSAQADYLAQTYALMLTSNLVERVFWYSFKDSSSSPSDSWGLVAQGNGPTDLNPRRQSFSAYATSARLLTGTTPGGRIQLGPFSIVQGFDQPGDWARSTSNEGSFAISAEQHHGGPASGKLQYHFSGPSQAVDFAPPLPNPLPGKPTRLGLLALGDGSGDYLSAWLKDRDGELFKVRLGAVTGAADGWRYFESAINNYYFDWEKAGGNPANGKPDYPLFFVGLRLENTPDEPAGSGAIYVDDLQSWDGPDVTAVRFNRPDGSVVDVLWSLNPTQANLPTASTSAQVVARDGAQSSVDAQNGMLSLKVSGSPIYVIHKPAKSAPIQPTIPDLPNPPNTPITSTANITSTSGTTGASANGGNPTSTPLCMAAAHTADLDQAGNIYFAPTGHNLSGPFRTYWENNGGVNVLGYPITELFEAPSSDGKSYKQQYFERARLEYHQENRPPADVQIGLLGVWAARDHNFPRSAQAQGQASQAGVYFPETGQTLLGFKEWWSANGGLPTFGYPISPEAQARNAADGKTYTVQYFERNRLELHPENAGTPRAVMLGLLGVEYLSQQGCLL